MIENYKSRVNKILIFLELSISLFKDRIIFEKYNPVILSSGIIRFDNSKKYLDTSSIEGVNNIIKDEKVTFKSRPSRANMLPIENSVWFAKMKDSNKKLILTEKDNDIINNYILSTGFTGIKATNELPLAFLTSIIISSEFNKERDLLSSGTTMESINNNAILKLNVPLLNEIEILNFENKNVNLVNELSQLRQKITILKNIKALLLQKYF